MQMKFRRRWAVFFITLLILWITLRRNGKPKKHININFALDDENLEFNSTFIGMIRDKNDDKIRSAGYERHAFNELISIRLGYHRHIPDTRHHLCQSLVYSKQLPKASVVICHHNEAQSTLLRTIHSILDRTPNHLLHEIIVVDDFSNIDHLKETNTYLKTLKKVLTYRTEKREGLIRGRAFGASQASGDVLVFLDSHCEVNIEWLPPLLQPIWKDSHTVVCPVIDIINSDTFQYISSPLVKGGFNWGLHFQWEPISPTSQDFVKPIKSATMAGGLFAIHRTYFNQLGKYDEGMAIWGGENLEISFRIWMCGGELKIVPCSRVGHMFRDRRPYGGHHGDTMTYNSMRVAEVWMDEYKEHFYHLTKDAKGKNFGDVSERQALRRQLKCKSFKWYLYHVYPEIDIPGVRKGTSLLWERTVVKKKKILRQGKLGNDMGFCLNVREQSLSKGARVVIQLCADMGPKNAWSYNDIKQLKLQNKLCLDVKKNSSPRLMKCHESGSGQHWEFYKGFLYNPGTGRCLSQTWNGKATLDICTSHNASQRWSFL